MNSEIHLHRLSIECKLADRHQMCEIEDNSVDNKRQTKGLLAF